MTDIGALYEEHWPATYQFLRRQLPGATDQEVEDLSAEVFLKVLRTQPQYQDQGKDRAWLKKIAKNLMIDHLRARASRPVTEELDEAHLGRATLDAGSTLQVRAMDLERALMRLPAHWRMILVDYFYLDAPVQETAALMRSSPSGVQKMRAAALNRLRKDLWLNEDDVS
jgi:RNA polymerase sigma-70 factor (ECF subfamily)